MSLRPQMLLGFSHGQIVIGAILFLISLVVTTSIVTAFVVLIRPDHFLAKDRGLADKISSPALRVAAQIGKNLLGLLLVLAGLLLSLPGVPGQGVLTMLVGLLLLDIPGKRRLELALVRREAVHRPINMIRARFDRPPLVLDAECGDLGPEPKLGKSDQSRSEPKSESPDS